MKKLVLVLLVALCFTTFYSCHSSKSSVPTTAVSDMSADQMKSYFMSNPDVQNKVKDALVDENSPLRKQATEYLKTNPDTQAKVTDFIAKNPDAKGNLMKYVMDNPELTNKLMNWISNNPKVLKQAMSLIGM
ncbi:hypothetical protein [Formosa haliotis]|uniref:hypothetical protein n=1 Tax=Formosa haliotis TaxID=1555194 RepID=UPI0011467403|nr:hypothetical protein [Formosa haliotis]